MDLYLQSLNCRTPKDTQHTAQPTDLSHSHKNSTNNYNTTKSNNVQVVSLLFLYVNRSLCRFTNLIEYRILHRTIFDKTCLALVQQPPLENSCCWKRPLQSCPVLFAWWWNVSSGAPMATVTTWKIITTPRLVSFTAPKWTESSSRLPKNNPKKAWQIQLLLPISSKNSTVHSPAF